MCQIAWIAKLHTTIPNYYRFFIFLSNLLISHYTSNIHSKYFLLEEQVNDEIQITNSDCQINSDSESVSSDVISVEQGRMVYIIFNIGIVHFITKIFIINYHIIIVYLVMGLYHMKYVSGTLLQFYF